MTTPRAGHAAALDFVPTAGVASSSGCAGSQSEQKPADQSTGTITRQKAGTYAESDLRTVTLTVKDVDTKNRRGRSRRWCSRRRT